MTSRDGAQGLEPTVLEGAWRHRWIVLLVTVAFFMGVWRYARHERQNIYALVAVSVVAYLMLTTLAIGFTTNYRYRMPVNAIIFAFAAYEAVMLASWFRKEFSIVGRRHIA